MGLPHLVCKGAEKNFIEFAQSTMKTASRWWILIILSTLSPRPFLFRTTEKLVSAQEYGGYRANIVAYTIAWLAEKSGRRIDLETIWNNQKLHPHSVMPSRKYQKPPTNIFWRNQAMSERRPSEQIAG